MTTRARARYAVSVTHRQGRSSSLARAGARDSLMHSGGCAIEYYINAHYIVDGDLAAVVASVVATPPPVRRRSSLGPRAPQIQFQIA